eukprot:m.1054556 g.1054556  ORF g.1054556 m.1054556 type:complete len:201 (-) comp24190_c0_seq4:1641-2243(-)
MHLMVFVACEVTTTTPRRDLFGYIWCVLTAYESNALLPACACEVEGSDCTNQPRVWQASTRADGVHHQGIPEGIGPCSPSSNCNAKWDFANRTGWVSRSALIEMVKHTCPDGESGTCLGAPHRLERLLVEKPLEKRKCRCGLERRHHVARQTDRDKAEVVLRRTTHVVRGDISATETTVIKCIKCTAIHKKFPPKNQHSC